MTSLEPIALIGHDAVLNGGNLKSNLVPYQLILKLAAGKDLTKTPVSSKPIGCLSLKWMQRRKRTAAAMKHL